MSGWCEAFMSSHAITSNGVWQTAWPDGLSYWEQDALVVSMFHLLRGELLKEIASANAKQ